MVVHTEPRRAKCATHRAEKEPCGDGARFAEIVQLSSETEFRPASDRHTFAAMEEGTKTKKTVFIGGIGDDVDESVILEAFQTFGG